MQLDLDLGSWSWEVRGGTTSEEGCQQNLLEAGLDCLAWGQGPRDAHSHCSVARRTEARRGSPCPPVHPAFQPLIHPLPPGHRKKAADRRRPGGQGQVQVLGVSPSSLLGPTVPSAQPHWMGHHALPQKGQALQNPITPEPLQRVLRMHQEEGPSPREPASRREAEPFSRVIRGPLPEARPSLCSWLPSACPRGCVGPSLPNQWHPVLGLDPAPSDEPASPGASAEGALRAAIVPHTCPRPPLSAGCERGRGHPSAGTVANRERQLPGSHGVWLEAACGEIYLPSENILTISSNLGDVGTCSPPPAKPVSDHPLAHHTAHRASGVPASQQGLLQAGWLDAHRQAQVMNPCPPSQGPPRPAPPNAPGTQEHQVHAGRELGKAQGVAERGRRETGQKLRGIARNKANARLGTQPVAVHFGGI